MSPLFRTVDPIAGGGPVNIGDGTVRLQNLTIPSGAYPTPCWVRTDGGLWHRVNSLPHRLSRSCGNVEVVTTDPAAGGIGVLRGNAPGYPNVYHLDCSPPVPGAPYNVDRPIAGTSPTWYMIFHDADSPVQMTAPALDAPLGITNAIYRYNWPAGPYGGGVVGQGPGSGQGNIFTRPLNPSTGGKRFYFSAIMKFSSLWAPHPISNKWLNLEVSGGSAGNHLILCQSKEGGNWHHCEQLGPISWFIDPGADPGQVRNDPIPANQVYQVEALIVLGNPGVYKVWLNGVLQTDATPNFNATRLDAFGWYEFRGGGGETIAFAFDHDYYDIYMEYAET